MSPRDDNRSGEFRDRDLDAAIRRAIRDEVPEDTRLDEDLVLGYLHGTATEEQKAEVQAVLARSSGLRRRILDIAAELETLNAPETAAAFAKLPRPRIPENPYAGTAPETRRPIEAGRSLGETTGDWFDRVRALFLKPAFAYAFTAALLAYPTYQYIAGRTTEGPLDEQLQRGLVLNPRIFQVRPQMTLRGQPAAAPIEITLTEAAPVLELELLSTVPATAGHRIELRVSGPDGVKWTEADFQGFVETAGRSFYRLLLRSDRLEPGELAIRVTRYDRATGERLHEEMFPLIIR